MSVQAAIGLDLGSQTSCLYVAKKGGFEVVLNEANYRETQLVVGFGDNERFLGEQGNVQLKSNFKNTIIFPTRFLGLRADSPLLAEEKKYLYTPLATVDGDRIAFEVRYKGEKRLFQPEQVVAMLLTKLQANYKAMGIGHNDVVISVPSYFTEAERKALLDAAKIAGINVVRLMNESTANVLSYGIFRKKDLDNEPKYVAFVDLGHSKLSAYVASFTSAEGKIHNQIHNRNLGTRDMDWKVWEHCAEQFNSQYGIGIKNNAKARLRLLDTIEKARKVLSANQEAGINVDCVAEGEDLNVQLTREKFEELIAPTLQRVRETLEKLKSEIKVNVQSIEIIGGGTRIPAIQHIIQEVFGIEVSRTLNSTENCGKGCAIQAAMLSPLFKVAEYKIDEANYYPIRCSWLFQDTLEQGMNVESDQKNHPEKQTSILFPQGCSIPSVKAITFHRDDPLINFKLTYDPTPEGLQALVGNYLIHTIKPKETEFGVKVRVLLNKNGMVEFESAILNEDYYEEVKDEKKEGEKKEGEKKEGEKKEGETPANPEEKPVEEVKKKKKTRATPLKADINFLYFIVPNQLNTFIHDEQQMNTQDRITAETYERKNQVESYIYDTRSKLGDQYANYVHPNVKDTLLTELKKAEDWLYGDGAKTSKDAYIKKIEELKFFGNPIEKRYFEYNNLPETAEKFLAILKNYENVVTSNDDAYAHITSEDRKPVLEALLNNRKWLEEVISRVQSANRAEEPPAKCSDITNTQSNFVNEYSKVINKPKPKPQEPPKEEKKDIVEEKPAENTNTKPEGGAEGEAPKKDMDIES